MNIPLTAGLKCPWAKEYFSRTPKETIIQDLCSFPEIVDEKRKYTVLHLAATAVEIPNLIEQLIIKKPSLSSLLEQTDFRGLTPKNIQENLLVTARKTQIKKRSASPTAQSKPSKGRFTLEQLKRLSLHDQTPAIALIDTIEATNPQVKMFPNLQTLKTHRNFNLFGASTQMTDHEKALLLPVLGIAIGNNAHKATGLHMAARIHNFPELTALLLENYPQQINFINAIDIEGLTPLANACIQKNQSAIGALLAVGADADDLKFLDQSPN